ncbi:hypothetical protein [Nostoc sp. UHCC 0252]|uniref:hypothetical protein n=1 Tax=Nostoc sp. UHCC 0252 TaxID=3110241 RepID=UPI002B21AD4B|nr:hypothetical protein [Nostoc sp. UHCC 0252]MEA5602294.1 hypothetical protein [Nostoc sp. UHCC 0252]
MTQLQRRQFGKLLAASLTSTIVAEISSKALAQNSKNSDPDIFGVNVVPRESNAQNRENQTPPVELKTAKLKNKEVLSNVKTPSLSVDNPSTVPKKSQAIFSAESDRITKAIVDGDQNIVVSTVSSGKDGNQNYLLIATGSPKNPKFRSKKILGLENPNQTVESLLRVPGTKNQLLCLVANRGIPPFYFAIINSQTGRISSKDELDLPELNLNHRYANLCKDSKGNIFATETASEIGTRLISFNLKEKASLTGKVKINRLTPLKLEDGSTTANDVDDLAISPSDELYALYTDNSAKDKALKSLLKVEVKTGKMEVINKLPFQKFGFSV